ncbi:unnamed protein product [Urochloa humidicola]
MASNPLTFAPIGVDAITGGGGYFMSGGGMMSADMPHFHPSILLDYGGFGFGDAAAGGAAPASDMGASFAGNGVTLASFASQLFATATAPAPPEDMDEDFGAGGGAGSCVAASLQYSGGHSGAMAVWSSSSKKPAAGTWSTAGGSRAVSIHEPYHLAGIPADVAGFHYALAAAAAANAPASSELSLTLCSKSSSDGAPNAAAAGQCSSAASRRSALTELPQARPWPAAAHFSVVVARSRYAAVAQELLNGAVGHMLGGVVDFAADSSSGGGGAPSVVSSSEDGGEWSVKSDLLKMLQLMDEKYNHCLHEIQSTTAKFNALMHSGTGGAAAGVSICAPFAHHAVSAVYRGLRRRIAGEIVAAASRATVGWGGESSSSVTAAAGGGVDAEQSWKSALIRKHWAARELRRGELQCWRPQRGLPEKSVAVLKAWLFENFLHPYPKDHEKDVLAARSGLSRSQVSNWFINARVRLWKPMIEEMYQDLKKSSGVGGQGSAMEPHTSKRRICELEEGQ